MSTDEILALLIAERNRLDRAIRELQGSSSSTTHPSPVKVTRAVAAPIHRKRKLSEAARKAMAEAAKRRWAAVRAAGSPAKKTAKHAA